MMSFSPTALRNIPVGRLVETNQLGFFVIAKARRLGPTSGIPAIVVGGGSECSSDWKKSAAALLRGLAVGLPRIPASLLHQRRRSM